MTRSSAASAVERANQPGFTTTSEPPVVWATVRVCVPSLVVAVMAIEFAVTPLSFAVRVTTAEATVGVKGMSRPSRAVLIAEATCAAVLTSSLVVSWTALSPAT